MIGKRRKMGAASAVVAGIAALIFGTPRVRGQCSAGQICCPGQIESQTVGCGSTGCTGSITINICSGGDTSGTGQCYNTTTVYCCSTAQTTIAGGPLGECNIGETPALAASRPGEFIEAVWVKNCSGVYMMVMLPVAA